VKDDHPLSSDVTLWAVLLPCLAMIGLFIWVVVLSPFFMKTLYTHTEIERLPSSTGIWTATVAENIVEGVLASEDTWDVYLTSKQHPRETDARELLVYDVDGTNHDRPRIAWSAPNVLRVTVPNLSSPTIVASHLDGVAVDLHYDPDDPVARAKWQRELDSDQGTPQ
jgi:hypothetical protein